MRFDCLGLRAGNDDRSIGKDVLQRTHDAGLPMGEEWADDANEFVGTSARRWLAAVEAGSVAVAAIEAIENE